MPQKQLFFVLGMHRSGTSTVTRALKVLNIDIGTRTLARADNPKGFFEDTTFVHINERLFAEASLHWDSVAAIGSGTFHAFLNSPIAGQAASYLASFCGGNGPWALKDPRASRLLPFWRPLCVREHINLSCIIALRHPSHVAQSLEKRDGMQRENAFALWLLYTTEALLFSRQLPRMLISYDSLLDQPKRELIRLSHAFSLSVNENELRLFQTSFLDSTLRHAKTPSETQSDQGCNQRAALRLYRELTPSLQDPDASLLDSAKVEAHVCREYARLHKESSNL